ncbi:hypothetical protein COY27_03630 [Candidatus Woesearchaeota archaeon CG_4_10_14_0_2_um_filter_33_13]|nr:MAG: hypothetical protein COY27_03630 [Candidatus Woesearchaeota archaeon CG_4_10_14_0_2_um_filter_33_13]
MIKKRASLKAQITIFMIVGLLILFVFIFMFQLVSQTTKGQLQDAKEQILTKAFKKEALRIYVDDCLNDELEQGLILLGQQGRIWSDQPGGTKEFSSGITGTESFPGSENRLSYAISKGEYSPYSNAYPCQNKTDNSPEFCQYSFPDTEIGFGKLDLKPSTLTDDLKNYVINRTIACIYNYTKSNISSKADVEIENLQLDLQLMDDGINVKAEFPLKFSLGQEEFFYLSTFDFFYPTQFKWLIESAVTRPLLYDWKYIDFDYNSSVLEQPLFTYASSLQSANCQPFDNYFSCDRSLFYEKYSLLGVQMNKEENAKGDDVFTFTSPQIVNLPGFYEFKFARQNRPPALNYINRSQCLANNYDYLVIIDDVPETFYLGGKTTPFTINNGAITDLNVYSITSSNSDFVVFQEEFPLIVAPGFNHTLFVEFKPSIDGNQSTELVLNTSLGLQSYLLEGTGYLPQEEINQSCLKFDDTYHGDVKLSLCARDPDEDNIIYSFAQSTWNFPEVLIQPWLYLTNGFFPTSGRYNITAIATDQHGSKDYQTIRLLVDRPMILNVSLELPYPNITSQLEGAYFVSTEDPVFVNVTFPVESEVIPSDKRSIVLNYTNYLGNESFQYQLGTTWFPTNTVCYALPWNTPKTCTPESYKDDLIDWKTNLLNPPFNNFREETENAWLNLSFASNYCDSLEKDKSMGVSVVVKSCVPYQNSEHPFAFNPVGKYHQYTFGLDNESKTNFSDIKPKQTNFNPLLATHSCCAGDPDLPGTWELKEEGEVCFTNPIVGCYGGVEGTTSLSGYRSYILEIEKDTCDGTRGNVCSGGKIYSYYKNKDNPPQELICGDNQPGCAGIANKCRGQPAWSYVNLDDDPEKAELWCSGKMGCSDGSCNTTVVAEYLIGNYGNYRYQRIINGLINTNEDFGMHCGCRADDEAKPCDANLDGTFEGACRGGECVFGEAVNVEEPLIGEPEEIQPMEPFCTPNQKICLKDVSLGDYPFEEWGHDQEQIDDLQEQIDEMLKDYPEAIISCNKQGTNFDQPDNLCQGGSCNNGQCIFEED